MSVSVKPERTRLTAAQKRYRLLEWVAALSGDFVADRRFGKWRDRHQEHLGGMVGIWQWLIDRAEEAHRATAGIVDLEEEYGISFYELQEQLVDALYKADCDPFIFIVTRLERSLRENKPERWNCRDPVAQRAHVRQATGRLHRLQRRRR